MFFIEFLILIKYDMLNYVKYIINKDINCFLKGKQISYVFNNLFYEIDNIKINFTG